MGNVYPFASVAFQSLGALALGPADVVICGAAGPGQSQAALLQRLREGSGNRVAWSDIVPGQDPEHCLGTQKAGDRLKAEANKVAATLVCPSDALGTLTKPLLLPPWLLQLLRLVAYHCRGAALSVDALIVTGFKVKASFSFCLSLSADECSWYGRVKAMPELDVP